VTNHQLKALIDQGEDGRRSTPWDDYGTGVASAFEPADQSTPSALR
jgi:hypothetical protein